MDQYLHHKALVCVAHASPVPDAGADQVAAGAAQEGQQSEAAGELIAAGTENKTGGRLPSSEPNNHANMYTCEQLGTLKQHERTPAGTFARASVR